MEVEVPTHAGYALSGDSSYPCIIRKDPAMWNGKLQARGMSLCFALLAFSFVSPQHVFLILPSIGREEVVHDSMSFPSPWLP